MKRLIVAVAVLVVAVSAPVLACGSKSADQMAQCPMMMKGVERQATNLDNGVKIVMTAADGELAKTLQARIAGEMKEGGCEGCPMHAKGVDSKVENTEKGVVVVLTASDKDQVKALQTFAAKNCGSGHGGCPHNKKDAKSGDRA